MGWKVDGKHGKASEDRKDPKQATRPRNRLTKRPDFCTCPTAQSKHSSKDGVHSPVAAAKAEGIQVFWYVHRSHTYCRPLKPSFATYNMLTTHITAVDHSLLSRYVLKPYWWSQVINLFPMSMAPNAVRLVAQTRLFLINSNSDNRSPYQASVLSS